MVMAVIPGGSTDLFLVVRTDWPPVLSRATTWLGKFQAATQIASTCGLQIEDPTLVGYRSHRGEHKQQAHNMIIFPQVQVVPAPERPLEPRARDDPTPALVSDGSAAAQCPASAPAVQPSLPEKLREGARAPPLHLRAESVPVYPSCGFPAPAPPTRTMESKIAAAVHSSSTDAPSTSSYHPFVTASSASVDDVLPLPLPVPQPKHASQKTTYSTFARPDVTAEPFGPENCLHFSMTPNCQYRPQSVPPHHN